MKGTVPVKNHSFSGTVLVNYFVTESVQVKSVLLLGAIFWFSCTYVLVCWSVPSNGFLFAGVFRHVGSCLPEYSVGWGPVCRSVPSDGVWLAGVFRRVASSLIFYLSLNKKYILQLGQPNPNFQVDQLFLASCQLVENRAELGKAQPQLVITISLKFVHVKFERIPQLCSFLTR